MSIDFEKGDGLVPAIVQDTDSGSVLMLGYMNEEALAETRNSGKVTFFSRSKQRLWTKGETSGNYIGVESVKEDCDGDSLLILGRPTGPVCHTGSDTCFGTGRSFKQTMGFLDELADVIRSRHSGTGESSYTKYLLDSGPRRIAQKIGEEAVELVIEAATGERERMVSEAADMIYHLMVLLESEELGFGDVVEELRRRHDVATQT
ncbi:MAG: bifunctional phosphoribosyl-AMP cyclohydrolase/phosphoribosyl-ATP diphosphatase HisIE [Rhodothermia bacterium]|nr:bifunctional phosphoribosyl-AMP cyclohydrolase/phosphoribosyl-ATP diphosphatase HisIE [Rhodothermia bacterium]